MLARMIPSAPWVTAVRIAEEYTLGSPLPSTTWVCQPMAFAPSTIPSTSSEQAVAWLHEITTIFLPFWALVGVVGPFHAVGHFALANSAAFAWPTETADALP